MSFAGDSATVLNNRSRSPRTKSNRILIDLHHIDHRFQKGHKIMVQVQSTWFPVIDRNPQKYVENIFKAKSSGLHQGDAEDFSVKGISVTPEGDGDKITISPKSFP